MGDNKMVNKNLIWLAGFMDGEGTIGLTLHHKERNGKTRTQLMPNVTIYNTNEEIMKFIALDFGFKFHKYSRTRKHQKQEFSVHLTSHSEMRNFLKIISPYLKLKKRQAYLLLEFLELRLSVDSLHTSYQTRCKQIFDELKILNKKGEKIV